jgi:Apea-like HEPN
MTGKITSDLAKRLAGTQTVRKAVLKFFELAIAARGAGVPEPSQGFYAANDVVIPYSDQLLNALREAINACAQVLGPKLANEKGLGDVALECATADNPEPTAFFNNFVNTIAADLAHRCIFGDYVVQLVPTIAELTFGPILICTNQSLTAELQRIHSERIVFAQATEIDDKIEAGRLTIGLPPVCWDISVNAARQNVEEEARWMIDVFVSLLRLSVAQGPTVPFPYFPRTGDIEPAATLRSDLQRRSLFVMADSSIAAGGRSLSPRYLIDDNVRAHLETSNFAARVQAIFWPGESTLAERLSNGLGWLTRGRRALDRAERLLYFFTAIEALISVSQGEPITQTIARYAAAILDNNNEHRQDLAGRILGLYRIRSGLVHRGEREVLHSQANLAQDIAEGLFLRILNSIENLQLKAQEFQRQLDKASYGLAWPPA